MLKQTRMLWARGQLIQKTHVASMESGDFTEVKYPLLLLNPLM
jgi:predicted MarR family transcription regulator